MSKWDSSESFLYFYDLPQESMHKAETKFSRESQWGKSKVPQGVQKVLARKNACYVLITCGEPSEDGEMQVEMTYEGDACLAAYLIESAQSFIDDKNEQAETT